MTSIHNDTAQAYAAALFELAEDRQQVDAVAGEIAAIGQAVRETPELQAFFANPSIKHDERAAVIERTFIPSVSGLTASFLRLLTAKNALPHLAAIADAYAKLLDAKQGKVDVDITVARQLGAHELELVRQRISTAIKKVAVVHQRVDESILGGIIIRVGDRLIDGSVKAQLKEVEQRMLSAV
jgi:F-type H+-transporting ATPase subunit delta